MDHVASFSRLDNTSRYVSSALSMLERRVVESKQFIVGKTPVWIDNGTVAVHNTDTH
jgi:hypothetical protein